MSFFKALKFKLNRLLISLNIKKERYRWYIASNELNEGKAVFKSSDKNQKLSYRQYIEKLKEEKELNELITTINEFLDISKNSDNYKALVAKAYKKQGYTVWEYSKDRAIKNSSELNLVLKKRHTIILVQCKNDKANIGMEEIEDFKAQSAQFLKENQLFENYHIKLRYTMSGLFLEESAYEYIQNNPDIIDYDIIKIKPKEVKSTL